MSRSMSHATANRARRGVTLLELLLAVAIVGVLSGVALPRVRRLMDRIGTRGAAADVAGTFDSARQLALARWARTTVSIDTASAMLTLAVGPDTIVRRDLRREHGVHLHTSRTSATYTPLGLALGVSNLTLVATRGTAAETVTVSRLGRVRW